MRAFSERYEVSADVLAEFRSFVASKGVEINEKEYEQDRSYIVARLKATIAQTLFGFEGWIAVMLDVDAQFQKALTLFPEAEKIAGLR
jgi:hypothetical protein